MIGQPVEYAAATRGHEALMALGGIRVFDGAEAFCRALCEIRTRTDIGSLQMHLAHETDRVNSTETFFNSVEKVLKA